MTEELSRGNSERINFTSERKRKGELHTHIDIYDDIEKLDGDDLINATRLLKRQKRQLEAIKRLHEACGQEALKDSLI